MSALRKLLGTAASIVAFIQDAWLVFLIGVIILGGIVGLVARISK